MSSAPRPSVPPRSQILRFALEGDRVRRAAGVFEREHTRIANALRRAVPFLARRDVPVRLVHARALPLAELLRDLPRPVHRTLLATEPGNGRGALLLDAGAISLLIDGTLGGNGRALPVLSPTGLSAPQSAFVTRLADGIARAFGDVLASRAGVRLEPVPAHSDDAAGEGSSIACVLEVVAEGHSGRIVLLVPKEALLARGGAEAPAADTVDPRVATALEAVDLELRVELARVRMKLGAVLALRVGDVLPLDLPVGGPVTVRADDRLLLRGRPTTLGGRIAVRIEAGHDR